MLKVIEKSAFKDQLATAPWQARMKEMVPSYGQKLNADPALANRIRQHSSSVLGLKAVTLDAPLTAAVGKDAVAQQ
jgi:malate dehydrogenase (quinone)